ncbi:MAG: type II toxin-antitoxin system RelE/ParE family toxin [Planctomycetes bacterium]|nr:type II toxin-antitoxin system RelE/ParE family toxin [Planctomycetota bacterium]
MTYKLVITRRAARDRDRAFDWFSANYSNAYANRWYQGVSQAIESITQNPLLSHKAQESESLPFELYEVLYGKRRNKHRILFTVENDTVLVLHIRHSAQRDLTADDF